MVARPLGQPGPPHHEHLDQDIEGVGAFAGGSGQEREQVAQDAGAGMDRVGCHAVQVHHLPTQPVLVDGTEAARRESLLG